MDANDIVEDNMSLLITMCMSNCDEIVTLLLDRGAKIDWKDKRDRTALARICMFGAFNTVKLLLDRGADMNTKDKEGCTPLHHACLKPVQLLLERGANVNAVDNNGDTPLHVASRCGMKSKGMILLEHGANTDMRNNDGKTPFDLARSYKGKSTGMVDIIRKQAKANVSNNKRCTARLDKAQGKLSTDKVLSESKKGVTHEKQSSHNISEPTGLTVATNESLVDEVSKIGNEFVSGLEKRVCSSIEEAVNRLSRDLDGKLLERRKLEDERTETNKKNEQHFQEAILAEVMKVGSAVNSCMSKLSVLSSRIERLEERNEQHESREEKFRIELLEQRNEHHEQQKGKTRIELPERRNEHHEQQEEKVKVKVEADYE